RSAPRSRGRPGRSLRCTSPTASPPGASSPSGPPSAPSFPPPGSPRTPPTRPAPPPPPPRSAPSDPASRAGESPPPARFRPAPPRLGGGPRESRSMPRGQDGQGRAARGSSGVNDDHEQDQEADHRDQGVKQDHRDGQRPLLDVLGKEVEAAQRGDDEEHQGRA